MGSEGKHVGECEKPMVAATFRGAIGHVAAAFRANDRRASFHHEGGLGRKGALRKELKDIIAAFEMLGDSPLDRRKAATPGLLKDMRTLASKLVG